MALSAFHGIVHGFVQGVFFRHYTREKARELGIVGWVRNLPDGTVELIAEGDPVSLKALEAWLVRGPDMARVDQVDLEWQDAIGKFASFEIEY